MLQDRANQRSAHGLTLHDGKPQGGEAIPLRAIWNLVQTVCLGRWPVSVWYSAWSVG